VFISREYDYALRILRALVKNEQLKACANEHTPQLTVKEICIHEHIPLAYCYKIQKKLEKASIVKGYRGPCGGYRLIIHPQSITLYDIYTAVEGSMYISDCLRDGYSCLNNEGGRRCSIHNELHKMQNDFIQAMRERTLAKVLETV